LRPSRLLLLPAAVAVHLCIGQVYALSVSRASRMSQGLGHWGTSWFWYSSQSETAFFLAIICLGLSAAAAGSWVGRVGPRPAMLAAAAFFGAGFLVSALAIALQQTTLFYVGYGVLGGIGMGIGYISPISALLIRFPRRRGLATGAAIAGFGGASILALALSHLLGALSADSVSGGSAWIFAILGVLYAAAMAAAALSIPRDLDHAGAPVETAGLSLTPRQAVRTRPFWLLWAILCINVVAGIGVFARAPAMLSQAMPGPPSPEQAIGFVGLLALCNVAGRLLWCFASDYIGRKNSYTLMLASGAMLSLVLGQLDSDANIAILVLQYGLIVILYSGGFACIAAYAADLFGPAHAGAIHGRLLSAWSAGAAGAWALSRWYDDAVGFGASASQATGTIFLVIAALLAVALLCNLSIRLPVRNFELGMIDVLGNGPAPAPAETREAPPPHLAMRWALVAIPVVWSTYWILQRIASLSISWNLGFIVLPLLLGGLVCLAFHYLDGSRFAVKEVVGPYFVAVSIVFALYASLVTTEMWQKVSLARGTLRAEFAALQSMALMASQLDPPAPEVRDMARDYWSEVLSREGDRSVSDGMAYLRQLYAFASKTERFQRGGSQAAFYSALESVHAARLEHNVLKTGRLAPVKLFSLLLFGFLTQIGIALVHAGKRRAIFVTVMLFSIAFAGSVGIIELFDGQFAFSIADATGPLTLDRL
jgi:MFS family permease